MVEKEIYIIRHGQTDLNAQGIVQGKGVDAPLNELGQKQAQAFYEAYKHVPFDALYSSTLLRAKQTIEPFKHKGLPHIVDGDLDEIGWGDAEGKANFTDHSDLFANLTAAWKSGNTAEALPGGESPDAMQVRQLRFIEKLKAAPYNKILIATHGRYIRGLMCTLTNQGLCNMDNFDHTNLCLYKVNLLSNGSFEIEQHNSQGHLIELMGL